MIMHTFLSWLNPDASIKFLGMVWSPNEPGLVNLADVVSSRTHYVFIIWLPLNLKLHVSVHGLETKSLNRSKSRPEGPSQELRTSDGRVCELLRLLLGAWHTQDTPLLPARYQRVRKAAQQYRDDTTRGHSRALNPLSETPREHDTALLKPI